MRIAFSHWPLAAAVSLLLGLTACTKGDAVSSAGKPPSLYDRLGGKPALVAVVDDFMVTAAADPRIGRRFRDTDTPHFKAALVEQLCASTGGPCKYTGRSMKDAHAGMGISDGEFNAMLQDLRRALTRHDVPIETQTEVVAALEPMRDEVVSPFPPTRSFVTAQMLHQSAARVGHGKRYIVKKAMAKKPVSDQSN